MLTNRFSFRAWITLPCYNNEGYEEEKQVCFENVAVFGDSLVGFSYDEAVKSIYKDITVDDNDCSQVHALRYLLDNNLSDSDSNDWIVFNADVIEQCTGLKDKNGKLIYEGDILLDTKEKRTGVVEYRVDDAVWIINYTDDKESEDWLGWTRNSLKGWWEIAGKTSTRPKRY